MKILFITRAFPPLVGGMERFASEFFEHFQKISNVDLIQNPGGKKTIIPFMVKTVFYIIFYAKNYNVIHIYDAVLFSLIPIIKLFSKAKISFTVNGLDIVYSHFGYQKVMPFFLKNADRIFAISQYTMKMCKVRGIPANKVTSIPIGIDFEKLTPCSETQKSKLAIKFKIPTQGNKILLTVGRLVKRKGHSWFISNVIKNLPDKYIYIIAGSGPELPELKKLIQEMSLSKRVFLLGNVSEDEKNCLYQISNLFIMPNISVKNDQEGFGIVVLEAGRQGLPVIASNLEGISDAVINGTTGQLIAEGNSEGFINSITNPAIDVENLKNALRSNFAWDYIIQRYYEEFEKMVNK